MVDHDFGRHGFVEAVHDPPGWSPVHEPLAEVDGVCGDIGGADCQL